MRLKIFDGSLKLTYFKFFLVGLPNVLIFTFIFWLCLNIFPIFISSSVASLCSIFYSYIFLKIFVFKNKFRVLRFVSFSLLGYLATVFWAFLLSQILDNFFLSLTCAFLVSTQNFLLNYFYNNRV